MGGCVGREREDTQDHGASRSSGRAHRKRGRHKWTRVTSCYPSTSTEKMYAHYCRNEPLKKDKPKWKSDYPMTEGQLRSKRDEFWDTAPAFEGRKEIWDALKAATVALECNDHELAQAIVDGASITLPHGSLTECYDELGSRYQLPVYCLAPPVNLISERSDEDPGDSPEPTAAPKKEFQLKVRLSTGKDLRLSASMGDSIGQLKKQLQAQEDIDTAHQRWFFSGKLLTDKTRLQDTKIQKDFVIQVIVNPQAPIN
ncbi:ubiquitin domain-containing protein 1 isoform X1 [Oncorhynchus tshawytscha]|uniref:Ubiquitin-like domain-containing protein n=1 Tax=Oncorhynchus tshawytscha TaxID=74940 RepID=A0A8C8M909_ONCTS|nr:ubiquitin domain-containing protein 1 isoform X1 [Oncorhynchus tshawytscha]XP_024242315.1 ubiquitin domain-containing protein 1 isoform X1 [Oncorhynchus tshawytscha]XP_024242316.1 ubiquitin domain-containing protein 1 isoform X1 [Oncorhynchus tshawytscha]XP_024242317.1 ubiquitin domain-containing protein 1 isoform X1 [Oncorhynchus tshawytscha]XP_042161392.1 ubiquitin domain-containing protein 1 isoform X1 [Oncorhynchus tshawytscha]